MHETHASMQHVLVGLVDVPYRERWVDHEINRCYHSAIGAFSYRIGIAHAMRSNAERETAPMVLWRNAVSHSCRY